MRAEHWGRHAIVALAGIVLAALGWLGRSAGDGVPGFRLDDAWIHMVYGREVARHGYLAYNPGIPATGASSPLWAYLLGGLHLGLGSGQTDRLVHATQLVNGALWLLTVGLGMRVARQLGGSRAAVLGSGVCLAFAIPMAAAVYSGMEVNLAALLLVAASSLLLERRALAAGTMFTLAALARPESGICALLSLLWLGITPGRDQVDRERPGKTAKHRSMLLRFAAPLLVCGAADLLFNLAVSGRPLPATFYLKARPGLLGPGTTFLRLFGDLLGQVPTLAAGAAWLALLAFAVARSWRERGAAALILGMGLGYAVANAMLVAPIDPAAFYHLRYVLPPVPLLIVGLLVAADKLVPSPRGWLRWLLPVALTASTVLVGAAATVPSSRHLHSDTRNINEVQRRLGLWLRDHVASDDWVASNDAGAIRYFSQRRTVDLIGLNTPELVWDAERYALQHPVVALVLMPAWFGATDSRPLRLIAQASTPAYTVTSDPRMGTQLVVGCASATGAPVSVHLIGTREVRLSCLPRTWGGRPALMGGDDVGRGGSAEVGQ